MDKPIKTGIVTGIVVSVLFVYAIQPLFRFLGLAVATLSTSAYSSWLDRVARVAAGHGPDAVVITLLVFSTGLASGVASGSAVALLAKVRGKSAPDIANGLLRSTRARALALIAAVLSITVILGYVAFSTWYPAAMHATFRQHLSVVAPHMDAVERLELESQWAQMASYEDYLEVYRVLEQYASDNSVSLPRNEQYGMRAPGDR